jgi:hypothetical protein
MILHNYNGNQLKELEGRGEKGRGIGMKFREGI